MEYSSWGGGDKKHGQYMVADRTLNTADIPSLS
jgi:hypothetical protein